MISVEEALNILDNQVVNLPAVETINVSKGLGRVLSETIISPISLPSFRQSSMDGYALNVFDSFEYKLVGESKAGDQCLIKLHPGEAVRILTGAHVPDSAQAIVIQEHVQVNGKIITIESIPKEGSFIRKVGEEVKKGDSTLNKGFLLNEASLGFITSLGLQKIKVYSLLKVSILITGNELVPIGEKIGTGKIYESNSVVIQSALYKKGIKDIRVFVVKDTLKDTIQSIINAFETSNLVLISGGISVGDYDFVKVALDKIGVKKIFYKVKQRPGKPLFFGEIDNKFIFALPGNPASTLNCFYVYVSQFLSKLMGDTNYSLLRLRAPLKNSFSKVEGRAVFLKAIYKNYQVFILEHQQSSKMISFTHANCLVYFNEGSINLEDGALVDVLLLR
jgi:molybdopterin molybdotransferase